MCFLFFDSNFVLIWFSRLRDVILTDARLYLIFEYLAMDLKKYLDCLGENEDMDVSLIRVKYRDLYEDFLWSISRVICIK